MAEYHDVQVRTSLDGKSHQAQCSCGYDGRRFPRKRDAEIDADDHVIAMSRG